MRKSITFLALVILFTSFASAEMMKFTLNKNYEPVILEDDKDFKINVISYNRTHIELELSTVTAELNKDIPLKKWERNFSKSMTENLLDNYKDSFDKKFETIKKFKGIADKQTSTYAFTANTLFEFGYNSTLLGFRPGAENGSDAYVDVSDPNTNFGTDTTLNTGIVPGQIFQTLMNWSFTCESLPSFYTVEDVILGIWVQDSNYARKELLARPIVSVWNETQVTWNTKPTINDTWDIILSNTTIAATSFINVSLDTRWYEEQCDGRGSGLFLRGNESENSNLGLYSSDNGDATKHPILFVNFTETSETKLPVLNSVNITPEFAFSDDNLLGFCNATSYNDTLWNVSYEWKFFENGVIFVNDSTGNISSGLEINLFNISSGNTTEGDNWTLSCRAQHNGSFSAWLNSSETFISPIAVGACGDQVAGVTLNSSIFNLTYLDEKNNENIAVDVKYDLNLSDGVSFFEIQGNFSMGKKNLFCTNLNKSRRVREWDIFGTLLLTKDQYATRFFTIDPIDAITISNNFTTNLDLYLVSLGNSSTVVFNWFTTEYEPINGIMKISQCLGNGSRILVESLPIMDGVGSANIQLLNVPYSYEMIISGQTFTDENSYTKCHIESQTELTFYVDVSGTDLTPYVGLYQISCNLTRTDTNTFKAEWGSNPEDSSVIIGCIDAFRSGVNGFTQVFQNCTTGTQQEIERTIPDSGFDYIVKGKIYQSGFSIECGDDLEFFSDKDTPDLFDLTGIFAVVLLIVAMVLMYSAEGELMIVAGIIALVAAFILALVNFSWMTIGAMIFFLLIILFIGRVVKKK